MISLIIMGSNFSHAQYLPVITNESGDTIHYTWPIPDSAICIKDVTTVRTKLNQKSVQIIPNPATESINLKLFLEASSSIKVKISDLFGTLLYEETSEILNSGPHEKTIRISKFLLVYILLKFI